MLLGGPAIALPTLNDSTAAHKKRVESTGYRLDIQGLRAVAVALVVAYHLWPQSLTGGYVGVDVFFVISGFLITSHLLRRPPSGVKDLCEFWGRRIRRLLPAAFVVLITTAIASRILAPSTQWAQIATEIIASAAYVQNWVLAGSSVDYLAADNAPTPVQHFWSLSVEEQYYFLWPILIMAAVWVSSRTRISSGRSVLGLVLAVIAGSLVTSIAATATEPGSAYFITPTRMWELACGAAVALIVMSLNRAGSGAATAIAWAGMAGIVVAGVTYTAATPFPGYTALLPVLGTALVIFANADGRLSPTRILKAKPIQWLGGVSYSVYLWHWPLLVLLPYASGGSLGWLDKLAVLLASLVLAALTKVYVEDKTREAAPFLRITSTYKFAAVGMVVTALLGSLQLAEVSFRTDQASQRMAQLNAGDQKCLGASALADPSCTGNGELLMDPALAKQDKPAAYSDGCWNHPPFGTRTTCQYGDGPTKVALVGNSHAGHWLPALQELADEHNWTITTFLASACNYTDAEVTFDTQAKTDGCRKLGQWAQESTDGDKFDLVVTSQLSIPVEQPDQSAPPGGAATAGYSTYLQRWAEKGTNILVIRDTPYPKGANIPSIPDCIAENDDQPDSCSGTRQSWLKADPLADAAGQLGMDNVKVADFSDLVCRQDRCYGVNGGLVTYFDGSHLTTTYARTLSPFIEDEIGALVGGKR
jgi:peptidoglycan/LPS O-acetylase OafA/YrhL